MSARFQGPKEQQSDVDAGTGATAGRPDAPPREQASARYRARWRWDKVAKATHLINCWYQRNCSYNVYVRDGTALWEEQAGDYPRTNAFVPDFNPRGCQKGACYALQGRHAARITQPLRRVGQRGEGKWETVSWDEALTGIADKVVETLASHGAEAVVFDGNPAGVASYVAVHRLAHLLNAIVLDINCEVGDEQQGAAVTFGTPIASKSADDYFYSDLILTWGGNPAYTQIPNYHFYAEARYNGARVVTISPDYGASAIHADQWVPVRPGTDAALALAMAQVIISERLYDAGFVREQTDLPLLVRLDTGRFLRESDLRARGQADKFYVFDLRKGQLATAPRTSLKLGKVLPALEGEYEVATRSGKVQVKPVFQVLREQLDEHYTPEKAAAICGTHPETVRGLAAAIAGARAASGIAGASLSKYYHGDLMMRAQILLFALCGQMGKKGAGYDTLPFLIVDGTLSLPLAEHLGRLESWKSIARFLPRILRMRMKGYTNEIAFYQLGRQLFSFGGVSSVLYWYFHGGLARLSGRSQEWDPNLKRTADEYLQAAIENGWQQRPPTQPPKVFFATSANTLRRVRGGDRLIDHLVPQLDLLVTTDLQMSSTALYSDYVLPAANSYEKCDVSDWYTPLAPFAHISSSAVLPAGEAKPEWEIMALMAKRIEEEAKRRGIKTYVGRDGKKHSLAGLHKRMTYGGRFRDSDHEEVAKTVIEASTNLEGTWDDLKTKGFARTTGAGRHPANFGNATEFTPGETITPHTWRVQKKMPWPTLTRRIQFYIDQPLYLELGEELPVHKEPPTSGGNYPLMMTGGHNRHSIHAAFRSNPLMLQLERGEPAIFMSPVDAAARGIRNGDLVDVRNDVGRFAVQAKVSACVQPGQVVMYHAWENFQFRDGMGHRNVIASPINPVELAGDYFHIHPSPAILQPGQNDRETRVEVTPIADAPATR